jgi:hypothetical protein
LIFLDSCCIRGVHCSHEVNSMNMAQNTQEKRTIKVKEFLEDFRSGMSDQELQERYHLTQLGLEKFYGMLMDRGILSAQELQDNYRGKESDEKDPEEVVTSESSFICPQCLASHKTMFDICPSCGVSFQEMINEQRAVKALIPALQDARLESSEQSADERDLLEGVFSASSSQDLKASTHTILPESELCCSPENNLPREFTPTDAFAKFRGGFEESSEEVLSGVPYGEPSLDDYSSAEARCDGCKTMLERTLRNVYDRAHSQKVLMASGAFFFLGLLAAMAIHFFSGYSFVRLLVVYGTGVFLLFGSVLLAVGTFLFMAKERVYCCPSCRRVYPRE